jgi:iron complex outermembrane recepter protein
MSMKHVLAVFLCFLAVGLAKAQNGSISGTLTDADSKEPIIGASVLVEKTNLGSITDLEGKFTIKNVPAGSQTVLIKYIGYEDLKQTLDVKGGETAALGALTLQSTAIAVREVEVFASLVEDRKTPVAVSTITSLEINEQLGGMQLPELLNSTPGIYATQGDGSYGDAYMNIRGFGQEELTFMINGVPMNDMENGVMYWSNFAGISEVTRSMQVQRGLGASKLAVNSVGGTVNIITDPSERRKGGRAEVTFGNGSYQNRYRLTLHSGELKGGWSVSFQGSRSNGEGIRPGTYVDAWSYFLTASKRFNEKHTLLLTTFGAPADRGRAYNSNTTLYERQGDYQHNQGWGYLNGQRMSVTQNYSHKPQITALHLWNINDRITVSTSGYASIARVYGTAISRGSGAPSLALTNDGLQNLEAMQVANLANTQQIMNPYGYQYGASETGAQSKYMLEARYNNHNWYGVISNVNYQINPSLSLVAGLDLRDYTATHYAKVHDLLGGAFWHDKIGNFDSNVLTPNRVAFKGDKVRYDYDGNVRWGSVFAQLEKNYGNFDLFASVNVSRTQMWRNGNMWAGDTAYVDNSLGKSDVKVFQNYNAKAGLNYRITGRHNVFFNAGTFTRAPFLRNVFVDSRYGNEYLVGLKNESIKSFEAGYSYRTSRVRVNFNAYYTRWKDRLLSNAAFTDERTGVRQALNGIAALHKGLELDGRAEIMPGIELTAMASLGDWRWKNRATLTSVDDQGTLVTTQVVNLTNLKVGNSAQTTAFVGMHYKRLRDAYFGFRVNYFKNLYNDFDPSLRAVDPENGNPDQVKPVREFPAYYMVDIYAGYYFKISDMRARAAVNVHNLLNDTFIRRSDEQFDQQFYGYPLNFNSTISIYF